MKYNAANKKIGEPDRSIVPNGTTLFFAVAIPAMNCRATINYPYGIRKAVQFVIYNNINELQKLFQAILPNLFLRSNLQASRLGLMHTEETDFTIGNRIKKIDNLALMS